MAIQWHPLFAELLRQQLEEHYDVQINVAVGDVPREADLVLLRRTSTSGTPFHGVWRYLKTWNILEYKGPSVSARIDHVDLLIELGLGIQRRLNAERAKARQAKMADADVCFWYVANRLGRRFRREVEAKLGPLQERGQGVWQSRALDRDVFLVSGADVPVELDNVPLHILRQESLEKQLAVGKLVVQDQSLLERYAPYLETFHPEVLKELQVMARTAGHPFKLNMPAIIEVFGLEEVVKQVGMDRVIEQVRKQKGLAKLVRQLSPAERIELKRHLERDNP